jgi:hypothetical protein
MSKHSRRKPARRKSEAEEQLEEIFRVAFKQFGPPPDLAIPQPDDTKEIRRLRREYKKARDRTVPCATIYLLGVEEARKKLERALRQARGEIDAFELHYDLPQASASSKEPKPEPTRVPHRAAPPPDSDTPCPYCGQMLRTPTARQCRHCLRDWHDPENVTLLEGAFPDGGKVM